jgi:hypothetical protein
MHLDNVLLGGSGSHDLDLLWHAMAKPNAAVQRLKWTMTSAITKLSGKDLRGAQPPARA